MDARAKKILSEGEAVSKSNPGHYNAEQAALKNAAQKAIDQVANSARRRDAWLIYQHLCADLK